METNEIVKQYKTSGVGAAASDDEEVDDYFQMESNFSSGEIYITLMNRNKMFYEEIIIK